MRAFLAWARFGATLCCTLVFAAASAAGATDIEAPPDPKAPDRPSIGSEWRADNCVLGPEGFLWMAGPVGKRQCRATYNTRWRPRGLPKPLQRPSEDAALALRCGALGWGDEEEKSRCWWLHARDKKLDPVQYYLAMRRRTELALTLPERWTWLALDHYSGPPPADAGPPFLVCARLLDTWALLNDPRIRVHLLPKHPLPRIGGEDRGGHLVHSLLPAHSYLRYAPATVRGRVPGDWRVPEPLALARPATETVKDPLAACGGFASLPAPTRRQLIRLAGQHGLSLSLSQILMRPEYSPEPELRAYAKEELDKLLAMPDFPQRESVH